MLLSTVQAPKLSTPATTMSTSSLCSQPLICLLVTTTSFSSSLVMKLSTILTTPTLRPTSRPSPVTSSVTSTHRPTVRFLSDTPLPMSKTMFILPPSTSPAVTMRWLALTSSLTTTIPGATRPPSPSLVGIKRWNFTATIAVAMDRAVLARRVLLNAAASLAILAKGATRSAPCIMASHVVGRVSAPSPMVRQLASASKASWDPAANTNAQAEQQGILVPEKVNANLWATKRGKLSKQNVSVTRASVAALVRSRVHQMEEQRVVARVSVLLPQREA